MARLYSDREISSHKTTKENIMRTKNITVTKTVNPFEALVVIRGVSVKTDKPYAMLAVDKHKDLMWEESILDFFIENGAKEIVVAKKAPSDSQ